MVSRPRKARLSERLADMFDLPKDVVMDLPRMSILGNTQISLENHRGIIEYALDARSIRINTCRGELAIVGTGLVVQSITRDEIVIEGRIKSFEFVDWGMA